MLHKDHIGEVGHQATHRLLDDKEATPHRCDQEQQHEAGGYPGLGYKCVRRVAKSHVCPADVCPKSVLTEWPALRSPVGLGIDEYKRGTRRPSMDHPSFHYLERLLQCAEKPRPESDKQLTKVDG